MIQTISVVGGGLAGISSAKALRAEGYEGRLLLIGAEHHHPYDRPALSKAVLAGDEAVPAELVDRGWLETGDVEFLRGCKVAALDLHGRRVELANGNAINTDRVVLATGSRPRKLDVPGGNLPGVHYLRSLDDSLDIREALKPGMSVVIIGGGLIGCEVATTAAKRGADVVVLEAAGELLLRVMGSQLGTWCRRELEELGVRIYLNTRTVRVVGHNKVDAVVTDSNERIQADLVLVSIGAEPVADLAVAAGLTCKGGVVVDDMGATASPWVYAAGDVAAWPLRDGGRRSFETYQNAQNQAVAASRAVLGCGTASPQIPISWTELAGHRIQMIGDLAGSGEFVTRGDPSTGAHLIFRITNGRVAGAAAIDMAREFTTVRRLVETQGNVASWMLGDPDIDLRTLVYPAKGA